jgi:carbamoylphosphate synthase large subunit
MAPATARASTVAQEVVGNPSAMVAAMVGMQVALVDTRAAVTEGATAKLSWPSGEL